MLARRGNPAGRCGGDGSSGSGASSIAAKTSPVLWASPALNYKYESNYQATPMRDVSWFLCASAHRNWGHFSGRENAMVQTGLSANSSGEHGCLCCLASLSAGKVDRLGNVIALIGIGKNHAFGARIGKYSVQMRGKAVVGRIV